MVKWPITPYKETLVPHLVATLIYLSQKYSYYIRGDISPLTLTIDMTKQASCFTIMLQHWIVFVF